MSSFSVSLTATQRAEVRHIATELAAIARSAEVLPGTIVSRRTHCGRAGCKCMAEPPEPHGPYFQWTCKIANKTLGRWLDSDQAVRYESWVANHKRLRELLSRLDAIGIAALEADSRPARPRGGRNRATDDPGGVSARRLSRG